MTAGVLHAMKATFCFHVEAVFLRYRCHLPFRCLHRNLLHAETFFATSYCQALGVAATAFVTGLMNHARVTLLHPQQHQLLRQPLQQQP